MRMITITMNSVLLLSIKKTALPIAATLFFLLACKKGKSLFFPGLRVRNL